jgi:4-amino-4-deoxy-L-arabinose transferase-like glycosyltransferase
LLAPLAAVIAAAAATLLVSLGAAPLERAEIYFVDVARAMVESGDYLVPRYRGEPFFDKPPLTYWLMAASFRLFGFTLTAARLVPVAAALLLLSATAWLGRLVFDRATGVAGAAVLASTLLFLIFGRVAMSDMLLALWTTVAVALALEAEAAAGGRARAIAVALGIVLGLGFMTKGPIALILPGLGIATWAWRRRRLPLRAVDLALATAAFAVVGLTWFALLYRRLGMAPLEYFFLRENLERFAGETYDEGRSPFYYLGAYLAVGLPWSLLFPRAAFRLPRGERAVLVWLALMAVPLSLARGKIDYYLLPLAPAASLVVARFLVGVAWNAVDVHWARVSAVAFGAVILAIGWVNTRVPTQWLPGATAQALLLGVGAVAASQAFAAGWRPSPRRIGVVLGGGTVAVFFVLAAWFLPAFRAAQPNGPLTADVVRERAYRPDAGVVLCSDPVRVQRDLLFDARIVVEERCDLWALAASSHPFLLVLGAEEEQSLALLPKAREVATYRGLPGTALTFGGLVTGVPPQPRTLALVANFETDDPVAEVKRKKDRKRALRDTEAAPD